MVYLHNMDCFVCCVFSVLYYPCDVILYVAVFLLCIALFIGPVLYCLLVTYMLLSYQRFFPLFFFSRRPMPGYNSQRRDTARTSHIIYFLLCVFIFLIVIYVPFSVLSVIFKCVPFYCHRVST
jgi:hypothetical protein